MSLAGLLLRVMPPANPPIAAPDSKPSTAAASTPSSTGLSRAIFCSTVSDTDCGSSSNKPSVTAPSKARLTMFFCLTVFSAPSLAARPLAVRVPLASIVSISPIPSFCANLPPAKPKPPVVTPVAAANPVCLSVNRPSSVCWRVCSADMPAPTKPSPMAPLTIGDKPLAAIPMPLEYAPPSPIDGRDSRTVLVTNDGLLIALPNLAPIPSAS